MNLSQARRLFRLAEDGLNRLDTSLFVAEEADALELDEQAERAKVSRRLTVATDALVAFAELDPSAGSLLGDIKIAVAEAKASPFDVVYRPSEAPDQGETEIFRHPLVLRDLLGRTAAVYMLDPDQLEQGLTAAQGHLLTICRNVAPAIQAMLNKKLIALPTGEHHVKHLLYAIVRASFVDAIPDGAIAFEGEFQKHKPDFGIPRLKCCVETKIARDRTGMSSAIDGIFADQSNYGSSRYQMFIGVIYSSDEALTQDQLDDEIARRIRNGGAPNYEWHWVLVHGPLAPSRKRLTISGGGSSLP